MEKNLTITAVSGWAIPPSWFKDQILRFFNNARVRVLYPQTPADRDEARELLVTCPADLYIGYSLGSLWLMVHQQFLSPSTPKALLAPILAFCRERKLGGKTNITQLNYLIRVLERNPGDESPLMNFYAACDLPFSESKLKDLPPRAILVDGLRFLKSRFVSGAFAGNFLALVGDRDIFLDGEKLKMHIPHLQVIPGADHSPGLLLRSLADQYYKNPGFGP